MTADPKFHQTQIDGQGGPSSEYEHWYMRRDENGTSKRLDVDTPGMLFPQVFTSVARLEEMLSVDPDNGIKGVEDIKFPPALSQLPEGLEVPDDVDVIVVVIDTDIPLGHRAFRKADGGSRVLYHWNIGQGGLGDDTTLMGREFVNTEITDLLRDHSRDGLNGDLDQDAFNRAIGSTDFGSISGTRGLQTRYSHGAHMMDVAAGANAKTPDGKAFGDRVGIVTVSMPSRWEFGEAGEFVDMFMLFAVARVYFIARALQKKKDDSAKPRPTVVSLAFGRQAGVKRDDLGLLAQFLNAANDSRRPDMGRFDLVMPVGNDNLDRVVARYTLAPGEEQEFSWNILPSDQSDNHLEVWSEIDENLIDDGVKLAVNLVPAGAPVEKTFHQPQAGEYWDVAAANKPFGARVYRIAPLRFEKNIDEKYTGYLFATSPTEPRSLSLTTVPSGRWTVLIKNNGRHTLQVNCSVQTDQSILPVAGVSGRSYLDDPTYLVRDEDGRLVDSVKPEGGFWITTDNDEGVQRQGTINAASSQSYSAVVGGYRSSDGMPASYSATGADVPGGAGRSEPDALMPTDDSAVLGGTLAAGSGDGSQVAMRGTSFAASKATRLVAETWLEDADSRVVPASVILKDAAKKNEAADNSQFKYGYDPNTSPDARVKFGEGRAVGPSYYTRTGEGKTKG